MAGAGKDDTVRNGREGEGGIKMSQCKVYESGNNQMRKNI